MLEPFKIDESRYIGEREIWSKTCYGDIGKWSVFWVISCPRCGEILTLLHIVTIEDNIPTVTPSIGCPHCRAHFYVKKGKIEILDDW